MERQFLPSQRLQGDGLKMTIVIYSDDSKKGSFGLNSRLKIGERRLILNWYDMFTDAAMDMGMDMDLDMIIVVAKLFQKFRNSEIQKFVVLLAKGALNKLLCQDNERISEFLDF